MNESGDRSRRGTPCLRRAGTLRAAVVFALLAAVSCLLGGCFLPQPMPENVLPEARFTCTPTSGNSPLFVSFDASGSEDRDGDIESYEWDFGDGGAGSGVATSHTYTASATRSFTATLLVTDDQGGETTASRSVTVTVSSPTPPAPPPSCPRDGRSQRASQDRRRGAGAALWQAEEGRLDWLTKWTDHRGIGAIAPDCRVLLYDWPRVAAVRTLATTRRGTDGSHPSEE